MVDESNSHAAPISTEFHSTHIESWRRAMETLDVNDEQAKAKVEIEASKVHWSELASSYYTVVEGATMDSHSTSQPEWFYEVGTREWKLEVAEDNMRVFRSLQEKYPGGFFLDENHIGRDNLQRLPEWMLHDDGPAAFEFVLSSETPFAEGGQAELFHAHSIRMDDGEKRDIFVMKVFKEGTSVRDLIKLFPTTMLANDETCIEGLFGQNLTNCNIIGGARLLKSTGRFAFLMLRAWGDLRKFIDKRMLYFNNQSSPFPDDMAFCIIHHIAKGMKGLHERDIVHRDLKAANVLIVGFDTGEEDSLYTIDPIHLELHKFICLVADFECSVGIVGTGFWRAPEILEALKNRNIFLKTELFSKQVDVYSFGMTCYEILSGGMPFEELQANDYDNVIGGMRPMLPRQTKPWMVDLVNSCWHEDPSKRPPFEEIVEILEPYVLGSKEREENIIDGNEDS